MWVPAAVCNFVNCYTLVNLLYKPSIRHGWLDDAGDVGDLMEEIELSLVEAQRWASHRLLYQLNNVLQLLTDLLWTYTQYHAAQNPPQTRVIKLP